MDLKLLLDPVSYHLEIIRYLQTNEAELWAWFSEDRTRTQHSDAVHMDLLKTTYRIEREANASLYATADEVAGILGITAPVTFYQAQSAVGLNMAIAYIPGEAHIVLVGPVLSVLTPIEIRAVLGHELTHLALLDQWRDYRIAAELLVAMSNDEAAHPSHLASARLFKLYTEVYCDRGSYAATQDLSAAITALVKTQTGTTEVSAESYLRQTDEILSKGDPRSEGVTHPETFIRAKALRLWVEQQQKATDQISRIIEGPLSLEELDLLGQRKVSDTTRRLLQSILRHKWMQTDSILAHAKLFFDNFEPSSNGDRLDAASLSDITEKLRDYYCYILIDFAAADRDLEEAPLAACLLLSDELGLGERFRQLAAKELNLKKKQMQLLEVEATKIVSQASEEGE